MSMGIDAGVLQQEGIKFAYLAFGAMVVDVDNGEFLRFLGLFFRSIELGLKFNNK